MKSSDGRSRALVLLHAALGLLAMGVIAGLRAPLAGRFAQLKVKADTYLLPSADLAIVGSLGYRSALADFIFAHVLVSHGQHFQEKRLFTDAAAYLEVINALDPKFRDPYRYADTLITMQPVPIRIEYYRRARRVQERGLKELPYDQELWLTTGQFLAHIAAPRMKDSVEQDEYRRTGARYMMRACDLIGSNENIPYHCITAANLLSEEGDVEASRRFLERVLAMTEDAELREIMLNYLKRIDGEAQRQRAQRRLQQIHDIQLRDGMLFVSRTELDALGPGTDTTRCAGRDAEPSDTCASSWWRLAEQQKQAEDAAK